MNPAALKIKGSPSDAFNGGKSNQEEEADRYGTSGSFRDPVKNGFKNCLEEKGKERRKVGIRSSLSYSLQRISVERHPRSII